ncbi:MAG: hypothetical protein VXZ38_11390, partial [Planctomycetota bacterium]|nr:hypothetical protein [Planctomycetota bacterium]
MRDALINRQRLLKTIPASNCLWGFLHALPLILIVVIKFLVIKPVNADDQTVQPKRRLAEVSGSNIQDAQQASGTRSLTANWRELFAASVFDTEAGDRLPYRILPPFGMSKTEILGKLSEISGYKTHRDTDSQRFPLVLFFHGAGERGNDNEKQLVHGASEFAKQDNREEFPSFVVFPQCPQGLRWVESDWALRSGAGEFSVQPSQPMRCAMEMV